MLKPGERRNLLRSQDKVTKQEQNAGVLTPTQSFLSYMWRPWTLMVMALFLLLLLLLLVASLVAQKVKNPPAMQQTWVRSLGQEDPLEKGMAVHSSILALRIPWTEARGGLQSMGSQRIGHDWLSLSLLLLLLLYSTRRLIWLILKSSVELSNSKP